MSYIDDSLTPEERVLYRGYLHWVIYGSAILLALVAALLFIAAVASSATAGTAVVPAVFVLALAGIAFLVSYIRVRTTELAVTNFRVLAKHGLIKRETIEQKLKTLDGVLVNQSVVGRILGYGSVETRGSGGGHTPIKNISDPLEFRKQVQMAANAFRAPPTS